MPRQPKWIAAGVYQPAYEPRRAYGPRRWGRRDLVEEVLQRGYVLEARAMARYGHAIEARLVSLSMPNGGMRWLLVCPCCQTRATRLYGQRVARGVSYGCRACLRLRYQSQYAGRRLEAHPKELEAAMRRQIERTPHDPRGYLPVPARRQKARAQHILRMGRYQRIQDLIRHRTYRHMERREIALEIALMTLTAHEEAQEREEMGTTCDENVLSERLNTESCLTELRRAYAALGQRQRRKIAA
jgi:hypothetical protein